MGKVAVIRRQDGGISYAPIVREREESESPQDFEALCFRRLLAEHPTATPLGIMDHADLPPRDEFRNAWAASGGTVSVDMERARAIQRDRLRAERQPLLEALDVEMLRAIESNDQRAIQAVAARKQQLRDVTALPEIDRAKSVQDLRAAGMSVIRGK